MAQLPPLDRCRPASRRPRATAIWRAVAPVRCHLAGRCPCPLPSGGPLPLSRRPLAGRCPCLAAPLCKTIEFAAVHGRGRGWLTNAKLHYLRFCGGQPSIYSTSPAWTAANSMVLLAARQSVACEPRKRLGARPSGRRAALAERAENREKGAGTRQQTRLSARSAGKRAARRVRTGKGCEARAGREERRRRLQPGAGDAFATWWWRAWSWCGPRGRRPR